MIIQIKNLLIALFNLLLVIVLFTFLYGSCIYVGGGYASLFGFSPLNMEKSLVCGCILLISQNIIMLLIKKG